MANRFESLLAQQADRCHALLRIVSGAMFAFHGVQKVLGVLAEKQPPVGSQIWIGGVIELVCGVAIAIGLFTRYAAFLASGTMAVAFFIGHVAPSGNLLPIVNKGELAVVYCWLFFFVAARGAGIWSADAARGASA
jgi:putative oxidoreductase